jgi:hypothetical protein
MNIPMFIASILVILYTIPFAYLAWIRPDKYVEIFNKRRKKYESHWFYGPWVKFLIHHSTIDIWMMRFVTIFFTFEALILLYVSFHGPIVVN